MQSITRAMLFAFCWLVVSDALACSLNPSHRHFKPDREAFLKAHSFPEGLDVPTPIVRVSSVTRGTSNTPGNCGIYAFVSLEVSVPRGSHFLVGDLGFVFRTSASDRTERFMSFPSVPVVATAENTKSDKALFRFAFLDNGKSRDRPFQLPVEVFAISGGLQIGRSAFLTVEQP